MRNANRLESRHILARRAVLSVSVLFVLSSFFGAKTTDSQSCGPCSPIGSPPYCGTNDSPTWNTSTCSWMCVPTQYSPIIVDVSGAGFQLTSAANGVRFDIQGTGSTVQMAWTAMGADNAFLALDRNSNGVIDNGTEFFGNFTPQPTSPHPNGFLALAIYDQPANGGNGDGVIDARDKIFSSLRLWIDSNHDGVCQPEELFTLSSKGINSINLAYHLSMKRDQFGNLFRYRSRVNPDGRSSDSDAGKTAYDVFFSTLANP